MKVIDFDKYETTLYKSYYKEFGKVVKMVGLTLEATGPASNINDVCIIHCEGKGRKVSRGSRL